MAEHVLAGDVRTQKLVAPKGSPVVSSTFNLKLKHEQCSDQLEYLRQELARGSQTKSS